jgi:tripartite-type tricarboxylate transporter receptor subunit TctC
MTFKRLSVAVLLGVFAGAAAAQTFPSKTIRLVSGVTPGAASDTMARVVAEKMSIALGVPVIVENRLGAGGVVAAKYVASAEPDGHLISIYTSAFTIAPLLNPGTLDPKELVPVATLGMVPTILITNPGKGYKSAADLVAAAKKDPGKVVCATAGSGSSTHMNLERFRISAGVQFLAVHTKGASEALTEVVSGRADCYFALIFQAQKMRDAGKVVALANGSPKRSELMPDVPTTLELGYADSDYNFWIGALVAAATPREIVQRLHREFTAALAQPDIKERMKGLGVDPLNLTLEEFEAMIRKELKDNAELVKKAGIQTN